MAQVWVNPCDWRPFGQSAPLPYSLLRYWLGKEVNGATSPFYEKNPRPTPGSHKNPIKGYPPPPGPLPETVRFQQHQPCTSTLCMAVVYLKSAWVGKYWILTWFDVLSTPKLLNQVDLLRNIKAVSTAAEIVFSGCSIQFKLCNKRLRSLFIIVSMWCQLLGTTNKPVIK